MNNKTLGLLLVSVVALALFAAIQPTSAYVWGEDFEITIYDNYPHIVFQQANTSTVYHFKAISLFQAYFDTDSETNSSSPSETPSFSVSLSPSVSAAPSDSVTPTLSESSSPTISNSASISNSAAISNSASISESASPSLSAEISEDASLEDKKIKLRSVTDDDHELEPDESTRVNFSDLQWALTTDYNYDPNYYRFNLTGTFNDDHGASEPFSSIVFAFAAPKNDTSYVLFDVNINDYKWVHKDDDDTKLVIAYVFWNEKGNGTLKNLIPNTNTVQINNGFFNVSTTGSLIDDDGDAESIDIKLYDGEESGFMGEIWVTFGQFSKGTVLSTNSAIGLTHKKFDWKSKWWIVLVVVGGILVVGALIYVALWIHRRRKARYEEMV